MLPSTLTIASPSWTLTCIFMERFASFASSAEVSSEIFTTWPVAERPADDRQRRLAAHVPRRCRSAGAERAKLLDQVIFNVLVANTDAQAKNYSLLLDGTPRIAPLYDVSTVLGWDHVNQYHAQNIAGRKRKPGDIAARHWDAIAAGAGFNARQLRLRVQEVIDGIVHHGHTAAHKVGENPAASRPMLEHFRDLIEANARRIAGRLRTD